MTIFEQDTALGVPFGIIFVLVVIAKFIVSSLKTPDDAPPSSNSPKPDVSSQERHAALHTSNISPEGYEVRRLRQIRAGIRQKQVREKTGEEFIRLINDTAENSSYETVEVAEIIQRELGMRYRIEGGKIHLTDQQIDVIRPHLTRLRRLCASLTEQRKDE